MHRTLVALVGLLCLAELEGPAHAAGSSGSARSPVASRPNVVIYLVDTLRADHLGLYGYHRDTSPVLDRWAARGVIFDRAYAPCSWTKPSVVSLLSGLDPVTHGVEDRLDVIPPGIRLLSQRLKASGYSTFAAVTNPNVLPEWGFDRGFDRYDDLDSSGHGTRADTVSDYVEERMGELARSQPFLLYVHVIDPHAPYAPPAPFDTRFPKSPAFPATRSIGQYDGEVAFVDSQFGRVLDSLKSRGLDETTMTIFLADHGEELLDHGAFGHGSTLFDEVLRIPLVIRFPGGAHAGIRVTQPASLVDVVPTVLSVLGEPSPEDVDGRDLTQLLSGDVPEWANRELFLSVRTTGEDGNLVRGVLAGSQKYVRRSRPVTSESLYDLARDPFETNDLAQVAVEAVARRAASLDAYLAQRSSGIHLRILNDFSDIPVSFEALLRTTGRFVDVAAVRLEGGDRFELADDGATLRLRSELENRLQSLLGGTRRVTDEDGLVFQVTPPGSAITVEQLRVGGDRTLPALAGSHRQPRALPFTFQATDAAWSVRDEGELLGDAGTAPESATVGAYLGVIRAPGESEGLPQELLDRLRALGYLGGTVGEPNRENRIPAAEEAPREAPPKTSQRTQ